MFLCHCAKWTSLGARCRRMRVSGFGIICASIMENKAISLFATVLAMIAVHSIHAGEWSSFCRVRQGDDGRWWLVDPNGRDMFLRGIDHANWNGHFCEALGVNPYREEMKKRFASQAEWEAETLERLKS